MYGDPQLHTARRLFAKQGRRVKARTILVKIYNWFTEGFDTKDLQEAKQLLDTLS
jgi:hypothetical protein